MTAFTTEPTTEPHDEPTTIGRQVLPLRPWKAAPTPPPGPATDDRFYYDTVARLRGEGWIGPDDRVLVVAGSAVDRDVLHAAGLRNVVISNLDVRVDAGRVAPFEWAYEDAERLSFPDGAFDVCINHLGLHHCTSPHRGLLEMVRVARRGVLFFEPQETLLTRLGVRFGLGQEYETAAVGFEGLGAGGVRNTPVPNYVYRWTAREVRKALASYEAFGPPRVRLFHGAMVPAVRLATLPTGARFLARAAVPAARAVMRVWPAQANILGVAVDKVAVGGALHPWLTQGPSGPEPDIGWFAERFPHTVTAPSEDGP
jgi:SAM-dependent methyltransferase